MDALSAFVSAAVAANRSTNAVTEFLDDAKEIARMLDTVPREERGPLHGLPVSVKVGIWMSDITTHLLYY